MTNQISMRVCAAGIIIEEDSILLIEYFTEQQGLHYSLPGGAVLPRETIREALAREILDQTCLPVEIGALRLVYEYAPHLDPIPGKHPPSVTLIFTCTSGKKKARLPDCPDRDQTGVRWIPIDELDGIKLAPPIQKQLIQAGFKEKPGSGFVEEWKR